MNCCFPKTNHCEWWNINTHRCNHLGRAPTRCERYGLGRAEVGDWGRAGSVNITHENGFVKITPQISNDLFATFHASNVPAPLLPPHYLMSDQPTCCKSAITYKPRQEDHFDAYLGRDFGFAELLHDPLMVEQASASYLCGKLHGLLRRNATFHSLEPKSGVAVHASDCLKELSSLADEGLTVNTDEEQQKIINKIHSLVYTRRPVAEEASSAAVKRCDKPRKALLMPCLPSSVASLLVLPPETADPGTDDTRLLAAFDPLLVHLACRPVNWDYVGKGLLCSPRQTFLGQSSLPVTSADGESGGRLLLWSPPATSCSNCPPSLHMAKVEIGTSTGYQTKHHRLPLPVPLALGCNLFELEAFFDTENGLNVVTRWNASRANAAQLHLTVDESQPSGYAIDYCFQPPLSRPATSVCASPWVPGQWAVAGTKGKSSKGGRRAFIQLYSRDSSVASWRGRLPLESFEESFSHDCDSVISACTGSGCLNDAIQAEMKEYLRVCPSLLGTTGQPNFTPFGTRCSVNFSGYPGELYLTTSRRVFTFDTRQPSSGQELFSLNATRLSNGREKAFALFNEADQLTLTCPRLIGDVYLLLGSLHSCTLLDRRMPGRTVLQWSHGLANAPCYSDWVVCPGSVDSPSSSPASPQPEDRQSGLPQVLLCTGSQFSPVSLNLIGLNVNLDDSGPQLVGPSIAAASLRRLVCRVGPDYCDREQTNSDSLVGVLGGELVSQRIEASLCGLVMLEPSRSEEISAISLTSAGDLFVHSWHRSAEKAVHADRINACANLEWTCELRAYACQSLDNADQPDEPGLTAMVDLDEVGRLSDEDAGTNEEAPPAALSQSQRPTCWWAMGEVAPSSAWPDVVKASAPHLFADLCTNWLQAGLPHPNSSAFRNKLDEGRKMEEVGREQELDEFSLVVASRLRRLKQLLYDVLPGNLPSTTIQSVGSTSGETPNRKRHAKRRRTDVNDSGD